MDPKRWSFNSGNVTGLFVDKIAAMKEAGFANTTLWHSELFPIFDDPDGAIQPFLKSGLRLSAYQFLRDMEGISEAARAHKLELARLHMGQLKLIGGDMLVIGSTMSPTEPRDWAKAVASIQMFGELGKSLGVRVAYEPMCFSEWINDYRLAWKLIRDVDHSHVGLVLDTAHIFLPDHPLDGISEIRGDKIFLVELNDFPQTQLPIREQLRNYRLFPGEGMRPLGEFVDRVLATGYAGEFALEVFNATYRSWDPRVVAKRGYASLDKLFATR